MDALDSIKKYVESVKNVGSVKIYDNLSLLLYIFLTNVNARRVSLGFPDSELNSLNKMVEYLRSNSYILQEVGALDKLDENGAFIYSTDNSIYYSPSDDLLTVIGGKVGDGAISIIQDGQLLGTFSVNQDFDKTITIMQGSGENVITFSKPTTTEYYKGDKVNIEFAWSAKYNTEEQKAFVNNIEVTGITPSTTSYTLNNVEDNVIFKVIRKNYDGSYINAQKTISFLDDMYCGVSDYKSNISEMLVGSIRYKAKPSSLIVNASKQCVLLAVPSNIKLESAISANNEPLTSDFELHTNITYNNKTYNVYVLGNQNTLPLNTTITIKVKNG